MSGRRLIPSIFNVISHLLSPRLCLCCGRPSAEQLFFCVSCADSLAVVGNPCSLCGLPNRANGSICPSCLHSPPRWQRMVAPLVYAGDNRRLIHDLKFQEQLYVARALVELFAGVFPRNPVDVVVPVPLYRERLIERGFNQSAEIAHWLSKELGTPLDLNSLRRVRATESQSGLTLARRRKNIRGAFAWQPTSEYRRVAVVDDVITTGSTVDEITRVLMRAGVEEVEIWGLARALKESV